MSELVYSEPGEYSREEAAEIFASGDRDEISSLMVGLAYNDDDWRWVQDHCLRLATDPDPHLRYIAGLCILQIARIHGELDLSRVRPMLLKLEKDSDLTVQEIAEDAIEDIKIYMNVDLRKVSQFN